MEIANRHRTPGWLHGALGAAAVAGLVSCAGGVDEQGQPNLQDEKGEAVLPEKAADAYAAPYATDSILVRFKRDAGLSVQNTLHGTIGARVIRSYDFVPNLQTVELPKGLSVEEAVALYQKDPSVAYAEPNYIVSHFETIPNDTRFGELFGLHNTGQSGGVLDADIDAPEAWDITQGSTDVVVAVIDTGVDYTHPDLAANIYVNPAELAGVPGVDDDANGFIDDLHGVNAINGSGDPFDDNDHGTHVSGTIAASGNNGEGVVGVNWQANIIGCKFLSAAGSGAIADAIECMDYLLEMKTRPNNPVNIVATNNSWGGGGFSQAMFDAILAHNAAGILFVAAAGNSGSNNDVTDNFPSNYESPNVIAVLATDRNDQKASFSSFGARTVDVGAPGAAILSTIPGNAYASFNGTSMATPHVAGLVALLKAANPSRTAAQLKNLVLTGGDVVPGTDVEVMSGRRINAFGSLTCQNRTLNNRFAPAGSSLSTGTGNTVALGVLSINCDQPNPAQMNVRVVETGQTIPLTDPSGTGTFQGNFTVTEPGTSTLQFREGSTVFDTVTVTGIASYDPPIRQVAECRDLGAGTDIPLGDDQAIAVPTPFPVQFAGEVPGRTSLFVGSNGVLSFSNAVTAFTNAALPATQAPTIIAPFWDDFNPGTSGGGDVVHATLGTAPNREFVVEYRNISHYQNFPAATFQVVFFENSPNILFNYCDVTFESAPQFDGGASATIGVQVLAGIAQQHSFNTVSVADGDALLFTMGAPAAAAGQDQVVLPGTAVTLDGSASSDFDGAIVSYNWTQTAGEPVDLIGSSGPVASFTAPSGSGTLTFELTVTDDEGQTGKDRVDVIVNFAPLAEAGANFQVANNLVGTLDCGASTDSDGIIVGYHWEQLGGDDAPITGDGSATATFVAPDRAPQFLVFQCTVTDDLGFSDSDVVVAQVFFNAFPLADAGNDRIVRPGSTVQLDGAKSSDSDGTIAAYNWQPTLCMTFAGPCEVALDNAASANPTFTAPEASGFAHFLLTVTDNVGATATDSVTIHFVRQPPQVVATVDPECVSPGDLVTLSAACVDPDGSVASLSWRQTAGAPVTLNGASTGTATFTAPSTGEALAFEATCTDNDGQSESAAVSVSVSAAPVAVAVCAPVGVFEGGTVSCNGLGSQNAVEFIWSSPSDPGLNIPPGATTSFIAPLVDSFRIVTVQLTASNECGATATDDVQVVVVNLN